MKIEEVKKKILEYSTLSSLFTLGFSGWTNGWDMIHFTITLFLIKLIINLITSYILRILSSQDCVDFSFPENFESCSDIDVST